MRGPRPSCADRARFVNPAGVVRWVRWEVTPWRDPKGDFGGLLVMVNEITDVVEALEKTERSEQRLKLAADMAELGVWEVDLTGQEARLEGLVKLYEDRRFEGATVLDRMWDSIHPADRPAAEALWAQHEEHGTTFRSVHRLVQLNGPHIWVSTAAEAIKGPDGQIARIVGVTKNIDKEKRAERAMAKALAAAEAANQAKNEFLANMSLRDPHAAERRHGHLRRFVAYRPQARAARHGRTHRELGRRAQQSPQRRPRHRPHRDPAVWS